MKLTMAQALVKFLDNQYVCFDGREEKFVNGVFGIFGHGCVVGIGQALEQGGHSLTYYQGHNEQGMAHAAMAYAKQNRRRKIIACTSSIGPGALNMVTAAGTATANRIPLLLLPGDTFACRQPDPVLQQIEQTGCYETTANDAFRAVCKYWDRIARPEQLMTAAINAMRVLTDPAETGAVCLAMPQDVEGEAFDYPDYFLQKRVWYLDRRLPVAREIEAAAKLIANAKRPLLIAGGGVTYSEAEDALLAFAERFSIPIGETQAGKGQLPWDHPLNLGGIGVTGGAAANALAKEADLVIAVGSRLTDFTTASKWGFQHPDVKLLGVNVCAFDALKMDAQTVIADAKETLSALLPALAETGYQAQWGGRIREVKDAFTAEVDRQYAVDLPEGLFPDARAWGNQPGDRAGFHHRRLFGQPAGLFAAAVATGRKAHLPSGIRLLLHGLRDLRRAGREARGTGKEVYAMVGDGSFLMLHSELYTAVQEGAKINVLLFDNTGWGCIENLQNEQGTETFGTRFTRRNPETGLLDGAVVPIDFAKCAAGYGCKTYTATNVEELRAALADAKRQTVPTLIDIKVVHGSMSHGYDAWWRVGVAEVSASETVQKAYGAMQENIKKARLY